MRLYPSLQKTLEFHKLIAGADSFALVFSSSETTRRNMKLCEIECLGNSYTVLSLDGAVSDVALSSYLFGKRTTPVRLTADITADFSAEILRKGRAACEVAASVAYYFACLSGYPQKRLDILIGKERARAEIIEREPAKIAVELPKCKQLIAKSAVLPDAIELNYYESTEDERYAVHSCRDIALADTAKIGQSLCRVSHAHAAVFFSQSLDGVMRVTVYTEEGYEHLSNSRALSLVLCAARKCGAPLPSAFEFMGERVELLGKTRLLLTPKLISSGRI